jgi:hypothetical protein
MPQPKKYPNAAARQAAYRERQELRELPAVLKDARKLLRQIEQLEQTARKQGKTLDDYFPKSVARKPKKKGKR